MRLYLMSEELRSTVPGIVYFLGGIIIGIFLMYGGCIGTSKFIASHRTCESFNIDNYELRTHTDVPDTKESTCNYDEATHTKSTVFILDETPEELSRTIEWNGLKKVGDCNLAQFRYNPGWNDSISKLPPEQLYSNWGSDKEDSWVIVLDSLNQTYWMELTEDVNYQ